MNIHSFELFKSNVCHRLKRLGDIPFITELLESNLIRKYHADNLHAESLYLLAMLDYLSRINNIPLCSDYNDLRRFKLSEIVFPADTLILDRISEDSTAKEDAIKKSIPEFIRYNIVECDVRSAI